MVPSRGLILPSEERTVMDVGPVELVVLSFPGERADAKVVASINEVVSHGDATVIDLTFISRGVDGAVRRVDVDEDLTAVGLADLQLVARALVNEEDIEVIGEALPPGTSVAVIVTRRRGARRVASAVRAAGGEVELHAQVPRDVVEAAFAAADA